MQMIGSNCFIQFPLCELVFLKIKTLFPLNSSLGCKEDVGASAALSLPVVALSMFAVSLAFLRRMNILEVIYVPSASCSNAICQKTLKALPQLPLE